MWAYPVFYPVPKSFVDAIDQYSTFLVGFLLCAVCLRNVSVKIKTDNFGIVLHLHSCHLSLPLQCLIPAYMAQQFGSYYILSTREKQVILKGLPKISFCDVWIP